MHFRQRRTGAVLDQVEPRCGERVLVWLQINAERHVGDGWLWRVLILDEFAFHVRRPAFVRDVRAIRVQHIGVVEDPATDAGKAEQQHHKHGAAALRDAARHGAQARKEPRISATTP